MDLFIGCDLYGADGNKIRSLVPQTMPGGPVSQPLLVQVPGGNWIFSWLSNAVDQGLVGVEISLTKGVLPSPSVVVVPAGKVTRAALTANSDAVLFAYTDSANA